MNNITPLSPTAGTEKMVFYSNPVRLTDIQNGSEFSSNVSGVLIGNRALPTYSFVQQFNHAEMGRGV